MMLTLSWSCFLAASMSSACAWLLPRSFPSRSSSFSADSACTCHTHHFLIGHCSDTHPAKEALCKCCGKRHLRMHAGNFAVHLPLQRAHHVCRL